MILPVVSGNTIGGFYHEETSLSLEDRIVISQMLLEQQSFKQIALAVGKNTTSISRELRNHIEFRRSGGYGRSYNACLHRRDCSCISLCASCSSPKKKRCSFCEKCSSNCSDFAKETRDKLEKYPYVCNGRLKRYQYSVRISRLRSLSMVYRSCLFFESGTWIIFCERRISS